MRGLRRRMKTAQEMIAYVKEHNFHMQKNDKWLEGSFSLLAEQLRGEEEVHMCFVGLHKLHAVSFYQYLHQGPFAYALTDQRMIAVRRGPFSDNWLASEFSLSTKILPPIALGEIIDVGWENCPMRYGRVQLETSRRYDNRFCDIGVERKYTEDIGHALFHAFKEQKKAHTGVKTP